MVGRNYRRCGPAWESERVAGRRQRTRARVRARRPLYAFRVSPSKPLDPDLLLLLLLAGCKLVFHVLTNGNHGFHRDELATLDDARRLAWGYVAYPPLTPFLGRIELELFGTSLTG